MAGTATPVTSQLCDTRKVAVLVVAVAVLVPVLAQLTPSCPVDRHIYVSYTPYGDTAAGTYRKKQDIHNLEACVVECCKDKSCNVVFTYKFSCYLVFCKSDELCQPRFRKEEKFQSAAMVLVRTVRATRSRDSELHQNEETRQNVSSVTLKQTTVTPSEHTGPLFDQRTCEDGVVIDCPLHEECVKMNNRSRNGLCHCKEGYRRNKKGVCVSADSRGVGANMSPATTVTPAGAPVTTIPISSVAPHTTLPPVQKLVVSTVSKQIRLPENEASLSAFTVPAEQEGDHFKYEWTMISHPSGEDSGTMSAKNSRTVKLNNLIVGLYTFKVTVTAPLAHGEAIANVSVLPPKRINTPPVAVITPPKQMIKLPNTGAVLDGSSSTDDDRIVKYKWELTKGPIGYEPHLAETPTLQLEDLVAGNYTFRLTVEDSDHATSSTAASVEVVKEVDYPPTANAGQDIIIYLPQTAVTLNGNLSTDDKGIAKWEWTMLKSDNNMAVDMQNTRTPYLHLSTLTEGMYTFVLKVTDTAGQISTATVHVFVKPAINKPPTADAGDNVVITLPVSWATLDGSRSKDDVKITTWAWEQMRGPNVGQLHVADQAVVNATGLTKGEYEFQLTVTDDLGNEAADTVLVTVVQKENIPPHASAGGDQTVILPVKAVILNGSASTDDLGIEQWEWKRQGSSLAAGRVVGESDHSPVLQLTDLVPGRYLFTLMVTDSQGAVGTDSVSVIVKPSPHRLDLVEIKLNVDVHAFTEAQKQMLCQQLALLLREGGGETCVPVVEKLHAEPHTDHVVLTFYVERDELDGSIIVLQGMKVVSQLREKLQNDGGLLEFKVISLDTVICQNNCSDHGMCDQGSRWCLCEAFWMENFFRVHMGDGESNCDWSILYVVIVLVLAILCLAGAVWTVTCICYKSWGKKPKKRHRYALLDEGEGTEMLPKAGSPSSLMVSESDTDSEVLFESKRINRGNGEIKNGALKGRNGFLKSGKKIET